MTRLHRSLAICIFGVALAAPSTSAQTYTQVDYPGAAFTILNGGPNPQGTSVGSWFDGTQLHGFTLASDNAFTSFDVPGAIFTSPNFITPQGEVVGNFTDTSGVTHGFTRNGTTYATFDYPGALFTSLSALSPSGELVGEYSSASANPTCIGGPSGACHSFQVSKKGVLTSFDPPGATSSGASAVSPSGVIVGAYNDASGVQHGYQLDKKGNYTTIDFPGSTFTFVGGGTRESEVVGAYADTSAVTHSFLLRSGTYTSFDPPGTVGLSAATGINPAGVIVGFFLDTAGNQHGYIRTP